MSHPLIEPLESRIAPATLTINSITADEGNSSTTAFTFTVDLSEASTTAVEVDYATGDGTATLADSDYVSKTGRLTFSPGTTSQSITILINGDTVGEDDETFTVTLSNPTAGTTFLNSVGTGTIRNDAVITLSKSGDVVEGDSGTQDVVFTATLTEAPVSTTVTANYSVINAGTNSNDFASPQQGTLAFAPGTDTNTVTVAVRGDTQQEFDESFDLQLTQVVGAAVANNNLRATILTDLLTVTPQGTIVEGASGQSLASFVIDLGDYEGTFPVTVNYSTRSGGVEGSATSGVDFASTSGTLTFNDLTPQTLTVPIYGDTLAEASETFTVRATFPEQTATVPAFTRDILATIVNDDVSFRIADNAETLSATQGLAEGDSSTRELTFEVTLTGAITAPVSVNYTTVDGTGVRGARASTPGVVGDFQAESGTLTFTPGGPTTQTISITIIGDTDASGAEVSESFTVVLSDPATPGFTPTITDASGLGIIKNDDSILSLSAASVAEGQSGTRELIFLATLTAALPDATTFTYSTTNGSATVDNADYVPATDRSVTIPAGATSVPFAVIVRGDTAIEANETFTVSLPSNVPDSRIGTGSVLGTILNDDPFLSIGDVTVSEGTGGTATATFVVTLSEAPTGSDTVTVKYRTKDGTATAANGDFSAQSDQTLTFAANERQKTITIHVTGDNRYESASETFEVELSDPNLNKSSGPTPLTLARAIGTATILDDDTPTVSIVPAVRDRESQASMVFTVSLSNPSDVPISVNYHTENGTATAGSDYTARGTPTVPLTLTIPAAVTSSDVSVSLLDDALNELDETFRVILSSPTAGATLGNATSLGTIVNDDRTVSIVQTASLVEEAASMNFTVTLSSPSTVANPVTIFFSTENGDTNAATSGADYTATTSSLVIAAGASTGTISIPIREDTTDEADQTFKVRITSVTNAVVGGTNNGVAVGTIVDDDAAPTVQIAPLSVNEGTSATDTSAVFVVSLSQPSEKIVTVSYTTAAGTATLGTDFTAASGTVSIPAGAASANFGVLVKADAVAEPNETFTATISAPTNATLGTATATATIVNDDLAPTLSIADVSGRENTGNFTFTVTLSRSYELPVTVAFTTVDSTATAGSDYTLTSGTLTFAATETSKTITVPIANNDTAVEGDERFLVRLSAPTNATLLDGEATGLIQSDDIGFTVQDVTVTEDGPGNTVRNAVVTVQRSGTGAASVQFRTVDGTALSASGRDFTAQTGTLSWSATDTATTKTITIPISLDAAFEFDEQFTVELFSAVNGVINDATGTVTIQDNDAAPTLSVVAANGFEDTTRLVGNVVTPVDGSVVFTVRLSAPNEREDVTAQYETIDGTAVATDYTAPANGIGEVRIAKGATSQTISIPTTLDARDEADETFTLRLRNANAAFTAGGATLDATGTIRDNDAAPTVSLTGGLTIGENESGLTTKVFTARLSAPSGLPVTVNWSTAASASGVAATGGTALGSGVDFLSVTNGVLTFAPGVEEQTFNVVIADDALDEADEVFDVVLADPSASVTLGAVSRATATITDNDAAPVLTIGDSSIVEGAAPAMLFTVSLSAPSGRAITVNYSTGATGDTATATEPFADYTAVTGATLTFAPGETSKTFSIPILDDAYLEKVAVTAGNDFVLEDEKFTVTLALPTGATNATLGDATAQGVILNGPDSTIGLAISNGAVAEGNLNTNGSAVSTPITFRVVLSAPATEDVTFNVATRNGTALAGSDYAAISGPVSIAGPQTTTVDEVETRTAGGTTATFNVNVIGDTTFEATETFFVEATDFTSSVSPVGAQPDGSLLKRGAIFNDDVNLLNNGRTLQWVDVDGDLVTMTTNRGSFAQVPTAIFTQSNPDGTTTDRLWLEPTGSVGGRQLVLLSLLNLGGFAGATVTITADFQPGFPGTGDGLVNVGEIRAAERFGGELDWRGLDLRTITVEGDLAKFVGGDNISTTALRKLDVRSLGVFATAPGGSVASEVLGPIGTVHVRGDVQGQLKLTGQEFGRIGTLTIEGALRGGTLADSGQVVVSGHVGRATIGAIIGGSGNSSGALTGNQLLGATLGDVTVLGDVTGGSGTLSGNIQASQIGDVKVGSLRGGSGENSGLVFAVRGNIASFTATGDIVGGTGTDATRLATASGQVFAAGSIGHVKAGSLIGGTGVASGLIRANGGNIASVTLSGAVVGGAGDNSGQIFALNNLGAVKASHVVGGSGDASGSIGISRTNQVDQNNNPVFATTGTLRSVTLGAATGTTSIAGSSIVGGDGDFTGVVAAFSSVGAATFGGDIRGGTGGGSGQLVSQGTLGRVQVAGDVIGSAGVESGAVKGGRMTEVRIDGDVQGGAGSEAGTIEGGSISSLLIGGALLGGSGPDGGSIRISGDAGRITIGQNPAGQSVIGDAGVRSGRISIGDDLRQIVLAGDLVGGAGSFTGGLVVGGDLFKATLQGDILGGAAPAAGGTALLNSGFLQASVLHSAVLSGDLRAGTDAGAGNTNSGVIRTNRLISLVIEGSVTGTASNPAIISAASALSSGSLGLESLLIKGNVTFAEILAGYGGDTTASFRGQLVSADAQIGKVEIRGVAQGLNIVAGAAPGTEGRFGDATDVIASGTGLFDSNRVISSIASVILRGGATANTASYGIVAQHVVSVKTGPTLTSLAGLARGAGNDLGATDAADVIVANFRAVEIAV
jgi:hypothetical protein